MVRLAITLLVTVAVIFGVVWLTLGREPNSGLVAKANVVGGAAGLAALFLSLLTPWKSRRPAWLIPEEQLAAACDYLARETYSYWFEQSRARGISAPVPAAVRWTWSDSSVAAPATEIAEHPARAFSEGVVTDIGERLYDALPTERGRLIITGAMGSGKTATMLLLLLHVLSRRREDQRPVPIWLTLGSWNPRTPIADWVAGQLVRDYPGIALSEWSAKVVAREMFERGKVALFMDGLDEMPAAYRVRALAQLNQIERIRFVLTSRPTELKAAISKSRVFGASVVETLPLTAAAARDFLLREQLRERRALWETVVGHVAENPDCALATAFRTPLALSLAREIYMSSADPRELLDSAALPTADAVMDFLLERFLHLAYPDARERMRAVAVLRWLARRMRTRDLAWWKIAAIPGMNGPPRRFHRVRRTVDAQEPLDNGPRPKDGATPKPRARKLTTDDIQVQRIRVTMVSALMLFLLFAGRLFQLYIDRESVLFEYGGESVDAGAEKAVLSIALTALAGVVGGRMLSSSANSIGGAEDELPATTPAESYFAERRFALGGSALILTSGVPLSTLTGPAPAATIVIAATLSFLAGPAAALYLLERSMPIRSLGRVRLMAFLDDAHRRQVLRQVGPIYQFRHASIQDFLIRRTAE